MTHVGSSGLVRVDIKIARKELKPHSGSSVWTVPLGLFLGTLFDHGGAEHEFSYEGPTVASMNSSELSFAGLCHLCGPPLDPPWGLRPPLKNENKPQPWAIISLTHVACSPRMSLQELHAKCPDNLPGNLPP